ncbi:NAD-P-binding protein [Polyporus arcularius HHB13444]|uniref:NAD-P-binding protein n=1 Tax=Polyporus arcularius HHB13444 TaxID=1314778 RepID=A0A5C3P687_9APHY|nr:NAD-P-binding protein [Polyporus arcularius HHB13444]
MPSYAVIGASRGIGLEYVRQLAAKPDTIVFAVVRNASKSTHLQAVVKDAKNIHVVEADVADYPSLQRAAERVAEVTGGKLDYLIHSAARMEPGVHRGFDDYSSMDELDADFITSYKINALGVIHSISAFLPLLRAAPTKKIVVISTGEADPKFVRKSGTAHMTAYGMTKAAALIATTKYAVKLQDEGFVVVAVSPGLVDNSDTVGENGDPAGHALFEQLSDYYSKKLGVRVEVQTPEQSVSAQVKLIEGLKPSDNGLFLKHTGGEFVS